MNIFERRNKLKKTIRDFFANLSYTEVETPHVVVCPGTEVHLNYFSTAWKNYDGSSKNLFLRSSPELHMKQILARDKIQKIFQFATCFRNGGELSEWHNPEFTMLEWYEKKISFDDFITQTTELLRVCGLNKNFVKLSVFEAFERFAGLKLIDQDPELMFKAKEKNILSVNIGDSFETAYFKILIEKIEPGLESLGQTILYDYPKSQAALSKISGDVAKRFEIYVGRVELCNAFWELTDKKENEDRIAESNALRLQNGLDAMPRDKYFFDALSVGLDSCCGNALGFERLLAVLDGATSIAQYVPFRDHSAFE
jgi:lysyl-tRNA synthetase class 2